MFLPEAVWNSVVSSVALDVPDDIRELLDGSDVTLLQITFEDAPQILNRV